jgi:hypothetical protein
MNLVLNLALILFSAVSFLGFGAACLSSSRMKLEFERYRLGRWRPLIGTLQLIAAISLLVGFSEPLLGQSAAAGLSLMMLTGVVVRIRIHDTFLQMLPAIAYCLLNAYLCTSAF